MIRNRWEALQERLTQNVETKTRRHRIGLFSRNVDRVPLAENVQEYRNHYYTTPLVRSNINNFASDVIEPGYRVEAESDDAAEYLEEKWLPQAAIIAGEKHNDAESLIKLCVKERWSAGGVLIEHVRPGPESEEITGMNLVPPETVRAYTRPNTNILLAPEDDLDETASIDVKMTPRDEVAAFVQFDEDAAVGSDKQEIPLSQNDVTRSLLNPKIDGTWGVPVTETVNDDVTGFKNILRDNEEAIKTKAYGLWSIAFGRDVLEYQTPEGAVTEVIEWDDDDQDTFIEEKVGDMGPGDILGHDGEISLDKFEPDVPDLIDELEFYVSNVTSALPAPKYVVGFERDINQFVTERQDERYEKLVKQERHALERDLTPLLREVAEAYGHNPEGVRLRIEPEEDESPVMTLDTEAVERMKAYAETVQIIDNVMSITEEERRALILQLPETPEMGSFEEDDVDEDDPQVQAQMDFGEGDGDDGEVNSFGDAIAEQLAELGEAGEQGGEADAD